MRKRQTSPTALTSPLCIHKTCTALRDFAEFLKQITAKNTRYLDSYLNRKFERIAEMYTDNCRFMPAGFPMQIGPQGTCDVFTEVHGVLYMYMYQIFSRLTFDKVTSLEYKKVCTSYTYTTAIKLHTDTHQ